MRGDGETRGRTRGQRVEDSRVSLRSGGHPPRSREPGKRAARTIRRLEGRDRIESRSVARLRPGEVRPGRCDHHRRPIVPHRLQRLSQHGRCCRGAEDRQSRAPFQRRPALRESGGLPRRGAGASLDEPHQLPQDAHRARGRNDSTRSRALRLRHHQERTRRADAARGAHRRRAVVSATRHVREPSDSGKQIARGAVRPNSIDHPQRFSGSHGGRIGHARRRLRRRVSGCAGGGAGRHGRALNDRQEEVRRASKRR